MSEHGHSRGPEEFTQDGFLRGLGEVNRPLAEALDPYPDEEYAAPDVVDDLVNELAPSDDWNRAERAEHLEEKKGRPAGQP